MLRLLNSDQKTGGLPRNTWKKVVEAIEDAIPLYDQVNDRISFGRAKKARIYAIQQLRLSDHACVLDSGIGPGTTSKLILSMVRPGSLVGLDESVKQLGTAKKNLKTQGDFLQVVRGSFESLPFRNGVFSAVITCFALRDSLDLSKSVEEYARVCDSEGVFADVDIGKPDNLLKRVVSVIYVRSVMPIIAQMVIWRKMKGNPWRMIAPTYTSLPTNRVLVDLFKRNFRETELKAFLAGGVIVILGRAPTSCSPSN